MLMLKHNSLSFEDLITCERTMLKFIEGKLSNTGMHFKVWDWSISELYGIVLGMLTKLDLSGTLDISTSEMLDFIIDVDKGYLETAYHSFLHAVDVVAVLYYMLTDLGAGKHLSSLDCIALLIAGLCHDIAHPGLNNLYQINAKTELAKRYNDQSVLENHSCALTMDLLTKHKLLRNVHKCNSEYMGMDPKEVDSQLRTIIQKTILATDMAFHFDLLEQFNNMMESTWSSCSSENSGDETDHSSPTSPASSVASSLESCSPISFSPPKSVFECNDDLSSPRSSILITLDTEQRQLWLNVLIHAADLSNTVRPWEIAKKWSDLVVEEFFLQGDLEKKNKLPVSPNMDREQAHQCQISLGFGDFVVKPYFERFALFLYPAKIFLDMLADNREAWESVKNAPKEKPQPPAPMQDEKQLVPKSPKSISGRRVSLAAGLLIIPDDIQEKLRNMTSPRSPRHRKLKRSLSGRSYSHHSILQPTRNALITYEDDDIEDESNRKPTRRKSAGPNPSLSGKVTAMLLQPPSLVLTSLKKSSSKTTPQPSSQPLPPMQTSTPLYPPKPPAPQTNNKKTSGSIHHRRFGRVRRSSSLDNNMIRQITAMYGTGEQPPEQRVIIAGS